MRVALPVFQDRLSPVFDSTCLMRVFSLDEQAHRDEEPSVKIDSAHPHVRIEEVLNRAVDVVICAAISRECQSLLISQGVRVLAGVAGPIDEVLSAFCENRLNEKQYRLACWRGRGGGRCRRSAGMTETGAHESLVLTKRTRCVI
jgi:predicted Fe-Mo cluster-binding NifX family protein